MQKKNNYDETKKMLNILRNFDHTRYYGTIREQSYESPTIDTSQNLPQASEKKDINVINNVEVVINSSDQQDLILKEDEKSKIAQLIDDFRSEVSELTDFGKLIIYNDSAKLDGRVNELNVSFVLSAGDDNGVFLSNTSMIKISDELLNFINKIKTYEEKFNSTINEMISLRKQN